MVKSSNSPEPKPTSSSSQQVLRIPSAIIWGAAWSSVVAISLMLAVFGISGLFSPGPEPLGTRTRTSPSPQPQTSPPQTSPPSSQQEDTEGLLPIWLLVLIGLGSAGGSLLVTKVLMHASGPKASKGTRKSLRVAQKKSQGRRGKPKAAAKGNPNQNAATRQTSPHQVAVTPQPRTQAAQPDITVLSPQESTSVDRQNQPESLVEIMDLRKRHSLGSLMGDS